MADDLAAFVAQHPANQPAQAMSQPLAPTSTASDSLGDNGLDAFVRSHPVNVQQQLSAADQHHAPLQDVADDPIGALLSGVGKGMLRSGTDWLDFLSHVPHYLGYGWDKAAEAQGIKPPPNVFDDPETRAEIYRNITPSNTAEKIGGAGWDLAEFWLGDRAFSSLMKLNRVGKGTRIALDAAKNASLGYGLTKLHGGSNTEAGASAVVSAGLPALFELGGAGMRSLGIKLQTSQIKPTAADFKAGYDPSVLERYGLSGLTLNGTLDSVHNKITDLAEELRAATKASPIRVDMNDVIGTAEKNLLSRKMLASTPPGEVAAIKRSIEDARTWVAAIDADAPTGFFNPGEATLDEAQTFKRMFGLHGAWEFDKSAADRGAERVANEVYSQLKSRIEVAGAAGGIDIAAINHQLSDLMPVEQAIIRRMPVKARAVPMSLSDIALLATGHPMGAAVHLASKEMWGAKTALVGGKLLSAIGEHATAPIAYGAAEGTIESKRDAAIRNMNESMFGIKPPPDVIGGGRTTGVPQQVGAGHDTLPEMIFGGSANAAERLPPGQITAGRQSIPPMPDRFLPPSTSTTLPMPEASSTVNANGDVVESGGDPIGKAKRELAKNGITSEQRAAYVPAASEVLNRGIYPYGYDYQRENGVKQRLADLPSRLLRGPSAKEPVTPQREDVWRLYLGMPQKNSTFGISDYKPTRGGASAPYYFKINGFFDRLLSDNADEAYGMLLDDEMRAQAIKDTGGDPDDEDISPASAAIRYIVSRTRDGHGYIEHDRTADIMGNYTLSSGRDSKGPYISYYDKWDLHTTFGGKTAKGVDLVGRPIDIYDRLYYDPKTFEPRFEDSDGKTANAPRH